MRKIINAIRAFVRLLLFGLSSLVAILLAFLTKILTGSHKWVYTIAYKNWARFQRFHLNVDIEFQSDIPDQAAVIMANHRSYLDVVLVYPKNPIVFVAKYEVSKWPIIGWGGNAMSTLWVKRSDANSRRETRLRLRDRINNNKSVVLFPEGTTFNGPKLLPFKPGMFHTVAEGGFAIIPVALEYENKKIAWVDDDLFLPHFIQTFGQSKLRAKVKFGDPIRGSDGEALRAKCHAWIEKECLRMRAEFDAGN